MLLFAHGVAFIAVSVLTLAMPVRMGLCAVVLISMLFALRDWWSQSVIHLHLGAKGELEIEKIIGARETAEILPATTIFPWMILLVVCSEGKHHSLVLLADSTDGDDLRRLRVWLGWRASVRV
jgi:hypothetical protein